MEQLYPKKVGLKVLNGFDIFYPKHSFAQQGTIQTIHNYGGPESLIKYPLEEMSGYVLN